MNESRRERLLMAAIAVRAIKDVTAFAESSEPANRQLAEEARLWLFDEEHEADPPLTSFAGICELMNLDPGRVRNHLRRVISGQAPAVALR